MGKVTPGRSNHGQMSGSKSDVKIAEDMDVVAPIEWANIRWPIPPAPPMSEVDQGTGHVGEQVLACGHTNDPRSKPSSDASAGP